jgi:phage shock protein E
VIARLRSPSPPSIARGGLGKGQRFLLTLLSITLSLPALAAADTPAHETPKITQASLLGRLEKNDPALIVLDVRTPEEFAAGHVPRAINIPYTHLPARLADLPETSGKDIVLYCATGMRSEKAAERLRENGYARLLQLEGDMNRWAEAKRPIEK